MNCCRGPDRDYVPLLYLHVDDTVQRQLSLACGVGDGLGAIELRAKFGVLDGYCALALKIIQFFFWAHVVLDHISRWNLH